MTADSTETPLSVEYPTATHVRVTFHPQLWVDDRAVTGTDTETYLVPIKKALTDNSDLVADDTDASDQLVWVNEAPERTRNWGGPFYVTLEEILTSPNSEHEDEKQDRGEKTPQEST
jgi:hypothetical protein